MSTKTIGDGFIKIIGIGSSATGTIAGNLTLTGNVELPSTTNVGGSSLVTTLNEKANNNSPTFTGTVNLPVSSSVIVGGTSLNNLLNTGGAPSMSFGTATLTGTDTIIIPFRNVDNTADLSIGTNYNPLITVMGVVETLPNPTNLYVFTGNGTADSSGNSRNLTISSGTSIGTDTSKGGIITLTSGKLAYGAVPGTQWSTSTGHTLSFDFKYTITGTWTQILRCGHTYYTDGLDNGGGGWLGGNAGYQPSFGFGFEVTGGWSRIIFAHNGGGYRAIGLIQYSTGFVSNTWYHIDIIFYSGGIDINNPQLYVNNARVIGTYDGYGSPYFTPGDVLRFGNSTHHQYGTSDKNPTFANMRVTPVSLTSAQRAVLVANTPISPLTTQIVARNTNDVRFKILDRGFGYMPIVANKSSLKINATIVDGATIKSSGTIPVTQIT